jgi:hypothetical protein
LVRFAVIANEGTHAFFSGYAFAQPPRTMVFATICHTHAKQKCPKRGNISTINIYLLVTTPMSAILVQIKLNVKLSFLRKGIVLGVV